MRTGRKRGAKMRVSRRSFLKNGCLAALGLAASRAPGATAKRPLPPVDLDFLAELDVVRRAEWAEAPPRVWRLRPAGAFHRLTVHHAGTVVSYHTHRDVVACDVEGILAGHVRKNYGDIGYHFIVDYAGRVWEGRSLAYEGAHVCWENAGNIGVMLLGNFQEQKPSAAQIESLGKLAGLLRKRYGIKHHRVYGHRDLAHSLCPGAHLYPYVLKLRA